MFAGWQTAALKANRKPLLWPWPWGACLRSGLGPGAAALKAHRKPLLWPWPWGACWGSGLWPWGACWTRCLERVWTVLESARRVWRVLEGLEGVLEGGPTGQVPHLRWSQAPPRPWRRPGSGGFRSVRGAKGGVEYEEAEQHRRIDIHNCWVREYFFNFHFPPPVGAPQAREFSLSPPWGLPKLGNFHFPPPGGLPKLGNFHFPPPWGLPKLGNFHFSPPWGLPKLGNFSLFPPLEALQAAEFQIARQRRLDSPPNPVFFECVSMFLQWFPSKHGTLHFCRHKTGRKHHVRQCFQSPTVENTAIYSVFFNFSMFQCR